MVRAFDSGVRDLVTGLNTIPGVRTRASCEGVRHEASARHHADLAYVLLQFPLPFALQDFLLDRLGAIARIEQDGIYSRWPASNRDFLTRFADAARVYRARQVHPAQPLRIPLATLRARLARGVAQRAAALVSLCTTCRAVDIGQHAEPHAVVALLHLPGDQAPQWFAQFVAGSDNYLDPRLIEHEGWEPLVARTQRGDFGPAFRRRWFRFRSRRLADLTTHDLRASVESIRRRGQLVDFYFDAAHAHFEWQADRH